MIVYKHYQFSYNGIDSKKRIEANRFLPFFKITSNYGKNNREVGVNPTRSRHCKHGAKQPKPTVTHVMGRGL